MTARWTTEILEILALLFADFFFTFTQEVQRIWGRRFSGATAIFLLTRYSALAERVTLLVSLFLVTVVDSVGSFSASSLTVSSYEKLCIPRSERLVPFLDLNVRV